MAEPYFEDPLLAKWAAECAPETLSYIEGESACSVPLLILELLDGNTVRSIYDDRVKLRSLVSRELSGARRARERAVLMRDGNASTENDEKYTRRQRERANAAKDAAQYILEAFDGE